MPKRLEVISSEAVDPWYQWHFGKGFVNKDGDIVLEVVRYPDFATNQQLKEIATGQMKTPADGEFWRICVEPQTARVRSQTCLIADPCEFPHIADDQPTVLAPTYLSIQPPSQDNEGELFRAIARFDPDIETLTVAEAGPDCYPSEPIYVPKQDGDAPAGWVLSVVYDGAAHQSELWIYDSDRLTEAPVCRLHLPEVVPHSFHGTWRPG
jgi:all-trans-8'-apo-beta-carotenal 15,15'-oxygenase